MPVRRASRWFLAALLIVFCLVFFKARWFIQLPAPTKKDVWRIKPRFIFNDKINSISTECQSIAVHLSIDGRDIELDLAENELLTTDPPVFITEIDGAITRVKFDGEDVQRPKYLQDREGRAALMLRANVTEPHGSAHEIEGIIFHENETYTISPIRDTTLETNKGEKFSHELKRITTQNTTENVIRAASKQPNENNQQDSMWSTPRVRRTSLSAYEVQLLFVLDYSTFVKFRSDLSINGTKANNSAAIQRMLNYFAQVSNMVDLQYRSINSAPFTIRTKLTSIYIATRAIDSIWTNFSFVEAMVNHKGTGRRALEADDVLAVFTAWTRNISGVGFRPHFPKFDHAVLYISHDLFDSWEDIYLQGYAHLHSMCTSQSTSVVYHSQAILDAETCAHELGHSLGAVHDGSNNSCNGSMLYVMTDVVGHIDETMQNQFIFSSCSVDYFVHYISTLKNNCLSDAEDNVHPKDLESYLGNIPGQVFNANALCRDFFGRSFQACGGTEHGRNVCNELHCYDTSAPVSKTVSCRRLPFTVLDGTSCGNKRWCQGSKCVYNSSAPESFDDCPIGDFAVNFQLPTDEPYICSSMPTSYCYTQGIYSVCCDTCNSRRNSNRPGCEFGDNDGNRNCISADLDD